MGNPKNVSSPKATGARGVTFEHRVQAVRLLAMCTGVPCEGVPDGYSIVKLTFQGRVHGHNTDDLVVTIADSSGNTGTLRMQMKRTLTPTTKNTTFKEAIGLAWFDFVKPTFRRGVDACLIVFQTASAKSMDAAVEVASMARSSSDFSSWHMKVHAEGFSNARNKEAYAAISTAAEHYNNSPVLAEEFYQFVVHLKFVHHDLDSDKTNEVSLQRALLRVYAPSHDTSQVWARLVQVCAELNGQGGDVDLQTVGRHIGDQLNKLFLTSRAIIEQQQRVPLNFAVTGSQSESLHSHLGATLSAGSGLSQQASNYAELVPASRPSSLNRLVSRQLDGIKELLKACRYTDAMAQLKILGQDTKDFDDHQRALWYSLRGMCRWHADDDMTGAADDFFKAASLCDDEDKLVAARIHGHMLKNEVTQAVAVAEEAQDRFPDSLVVWVAASNARILSGVTFAPSDIPKEHTSHAAAWQVVAHSQGMAGDLAGALDSANVALTKEDASFFTKEAFLRYALQFSTQSNLAVGFRMLTEEQRVALLKAIATFSDRQQTLWAVQNHKAQTAVLTHLGYAYLLLGHPEDALKLVEEIRAHTSLAVDWDSFYRIEIEALHDLGRSQEALTRLEASLAKMPNEALVAYAQVAGVANELNKVDAVWAHAQCRPDSPDTERLCHTLRLMRWDLHLRAGRADEVRSEMAAAGVGITSTAVSDVVMAVRAYRADGGDKTTANQYIDRLSELLKDCAEPADAHFGAQFLIQSGRYASAAEIYGRILPAGTFSELHTDLLFCYLRTGQRFKARELVQSMAPAWKQSEDARRMALELARDAGDWPLVADIAKEEVAAFPQRARSWLLHVVAAANNDQCDIGPLIENIPLELPGAARELAQLASAEIRQGYITKALKRLYKLRRANIGDTEAAAIYLVSLMLRGERLNELDSVPQAVGPGTSVTLLDGAGVQRHLTIDPQGIDGLPATEEFVSADSPEAKRITGLRLNECIEVSDNFGVVKSYTVTQLYSAHRRLIELSYQSIHTALSPTPYLTAVSLPTEEDGSINIDLIRKQLERRREFAAQTLELYKQHPAPLGIIAQRLGCDVIDLVRGWPRNGPQLEVGSGWSQARDAAQELLSKESTWVVDLTMLVELATLGHLDALRNLPLVLVSATTRDAIARKLEETSEFRESGTMYSHEGQLGFQEHTAEDWRRERAVLQAIGRFVRAHCKVMPAYGPEAVGANLFRMTKVLSPEEYSTLLLAMEHKASVLTLDERFRRVAFLFRVQSVWPQQLLLFMANNGKISPHEYSLAVIKMLLWRRTFVSIGINEMTAMMEQGEAWMNIGVNALREYLCESKLNFDSAAPLVLDFIGWLYQRGNCEFGVALELIEYLVEPLLRHKDCPDYWVWPATIHLCEALGVTANESQEFRLVSQFVSRAVARSQHQMQVVVVKASVLYCTAPPFFKAGDIADEDIGTGLQAESGKIQGELGEARGTSESENSSSAQLQL